MELDRRSRNLFGFGKIRMHSRKRFSEALENRVTPQRFHHCLSVETCAIHLAVQHGVDPYYAGVAGLMHDLCHCDSQARQLRYIRSCGASLEKEWLDHPQIWHGFTASLVLRREFGVREKGVLMAVRYHTTARADMSKLEKIVYLADAVSLDRDWPGVEAMRDCCMRDLDEAMRRMLRHTVRGLVANDQTLVKDTWEAYNEYVVDRSPLSDLPPQREG